MTEALETLSVLKALRTAVETAPVQGTTISSRTSQDAADSNLCAEKRNKRQRMSPAVNGTPVRAAASPPLVQRATVNGARSHQKKSTPVLRAGRMVGFRVPADAENRDASEAEWILATIVKSLNGTEYLVQDVDQEGGMP